MSDVSREEFDALDARVKVIEDALAEAVAAKSDDLAEDVGDAAESAVRRGLKSLFG
jgi:hypothetical protein